MIVSVFFSVIFLSFFSMQTFKSNLSDLYKLVGNLLFIFVFLIAGNSEAQDIASKNETIQTWKISFMTKRLKLTPQEAQQFWPVYNQFESELEELRTNHRMQLHALKEDFAETSDAEIEKFVDKQLAFRQNEIDILKKYNPLFKKVLPIKKVAMLYKAEEEFKRQLLKQIKGQ